MNLGKPQFLLTRMYEDGSQEPPEIVPVSQVPAETQFGRRGLLGAGLSAAAIMKLLKAQSPPGVVPSTHVKAHSDLVGSLAITPDGRTLLSASDDNTVKVWSLSDLRLQSTLTEHTSDVNALAIAADGRMFASGSDDGRVIIWSLPDPRRLAIVPGSSEVKSLAITPDGGMLVSGEGDGDVNLLTWPGAESTTSPPAQKRWIDSLGLTSEGQVFATGPEPRPARAWAYGSHRLVKSVYTTWSGVAALAILPNGKAVASGANFQEITLWSLSEGSQLTEMKAGNFSIGVLSLAITPDGKVLAAGYDDNSIRLWSVTEGRLLGTLGSHSDDVTALLMSPDGQLLFSASLDKTVRIWSLPDRRLLNTLTGHQNPIYSLALTPDQKTLASGDAKGIVILWDLPQRSFRSFLFDAGANTTEVQALVYNLVDRTTGQTITYALPCGSTIPAGAACTCNCVKGTLPPPPPPPHCLSRGAARLVLNRFGEAVVAHASACSGELQLAEGRE